VKRIAAVLAAAVAAASCSAAGTSTTASSAEPRTDATPTTTAPAVPASSAGTQTGVFGIHVAGAHLVDDQTGRAVQLRGINQMAGIGCTRTGPQGGIIYGPSDRSSLSALAEWHVNAVRLTVDEDCWLGINGVPPATSGENYRSALTSYVHLLTSHHYYVVFDLDLNAPGSFVSQTEQAMADADHAVAYWQSVAAAFEDDPAVIFEPYNEPDITTSDTDSSDPWECWLDGCEATEVSTARHVYQPFDWRIAGMQQLVDAIRGTGASNVITLSGLDLAADLSGILSHLPRDPDNQLAATFHNYGRSAAQNGGCGPSCWDTTIAAVAARMPVITDEVGEPDCQTSYVSAYLDWADAHGVSYFPWGWELWGCTGHAYGLLENWSGTPNSYGEAFFTHFAARAGQA
jgi:endoglucanase